MQQKFKFMHRDLHRGNVMYKNIGSTSNPIYRMYIIDFGMSTATFNRYKLNQIVIGTEAIVVTGKSSTRPSSKLN